ITNGQRIDVGALRFGRILLQRDRALDRVVTSFLAYEIDRQIVIWSERQGHAPPSHRKFRVEPGRALKGSARFVVIKTVDEFQSLIEELLRLAIFGRDRMMNVAQSGH